MTIKCIDLWYNFDIGYTTCMYYTESKSIHPVNSVVRFAPTIHSIFVKSPFQREFNVCLFYFISFYMT